MPLRPPSPWQIGNDRVVGVEASEVIHLGIMVLRRPSTRPCDEAGEIATGHRSTGGCLPCLVLAAFDDHRDAFCGLTKHKISYAYEGEHERSRNGLVMRSMK